MCSKGLEHQLCEGKHAKLAAIYPDELCKAILKGSIEQLQADDLLRKEEFGFIESQNRFEEVHVVHEPSAKLARGKYKDDLSGQLLVDSLVEAARKVELTYLKTKECGHLKTK